MGKQGLSRATKDINKAVEKESRWLGIRRGDPWCSLDTSWGLIHPTWVTQVRVFNDLRPKTHGFITDDMSKSHHLVC